jgi:MFS family permease
LREVSADLAAIERILRDSAQLAGDRLARREIAARRAALIDDAYREAVRAFEAATWRLTADPATAIGWILGTYGLLTTLATWLLGRFVDRVDQVKLYWRSMLLATFITLGMALTPSIWLLGLLAALRSFPVAASTTLIYVHLAGILSERHRTAVFSLAPLPRNFGALVFPLLAAASASLAPGAPLAVGAVSYLSTCLSSFRMSRLKR